LPKNYDYYVYLDSDILYFGKIADLLPIDRGLSIVKENHMMNNSWFAYPHATKEHSKLFSSINGINAGTFVYTNPSFLETVRQLYITNIKSNYIENAKLEQSSFNYALCLLSSFKFNKYYDISNICQLHSKHNSFSNKKLLYHFCGIDQTMKTKYTIMENFYKNYIK
jgi:hypothetical protein